MNCDERVARVREFVDETANEGWFTSNQRVHQENDPIVDEIALNVDLSGF